jgi:hypothetical protein
MSLFLEPGDIAKLTGCKRRKDQLAWLKAEGYPFKLNKRGEIVVSRAYVEHRLGVGAAPAPEPDFDVYRSRVNCADATA